jgi:DNA-binding NtrC family response regulator
LDIKLPGMDGIEVLREIKKLKRNTGVIMITGFPEKEKAEQAMKEGAFDFIVKPFDLSYLELSVLTKILL